MELLKALSELSGAPGREERVRAHIAGEVEGYCDRITQDAMGNLLCFKAATRSAQGGDLRRAPRLMLAAHMDEIGFYVRAIDSAGFLRVQDLGSFDARNLLARRVRIQGRRELVGILHAAGKPNHLSTADERKRIPEISELVIDTGLPVEQVRELVRIGDPVTIDASFLDLGDRVAGKALDNRVSCWLAVRLLQAVKDTAFDLHVVFTVQEEVGIRGAATSAYQVEPDFVIALDVTLAADTPGVPDEAQVSKLGAGVAIKVVDRLTICDRHMVERCIKLAEDHGLAYQLEVLPIGGTDAAAAQRSRAGARAMAISVPTRYVHTSSEMVAKSDLRGALSLLLAFCADGTPVAKD